MRMKISSGRAIVTVAIAAMAINVGAAVMDDCEMLFMGGDDYNGNGCFDDGELRDRLHPGAATDFVKKAWDFPAGCITWTNMDVQCNTKSNVLTNQKCLYFHQKYDNNGTMKNQACALELPRFGYSPLVAGDYDFTVIFRLKLPDMDRKADGTQITGADLSGANAQGGTIAAIGNNRASGAWTGTDLKVAHSTTSMKFGGKVQNWSKGTPWNCPDVYFTNGVYRTRDAEWIEVAVRGYSWTYNNAPAPGTRVSVRRWDGSYSQDNNGGRNGGPSADAPFLLGNNSEAASEGGFQGAIHMVAAWKRELSDSELDEAFKFLAGPTDTLANDGNNSGLYKLGYDTSEGALFGNPTDSTMSMIAPDRFASGFPSNFVAGTRFTIRTPLDAFTKNMKQVLRLRTAVSSARGTMSVKVNGVTQRAGFAVAPSKTYSFYLPETCFTGDELTVELECSAAGAGGVKLATVEVCGSWTIGLKDNSTTQLVPGKASTANSTVRLFTVGQDLMTSFPAYWYDYERNRSRSYTDIKFYVPERLDTDYKYVFKGSIRGGFIHPEYGYPHEYILNGTKHSERFVCRNNSDGRDYEMTIDAGDLTNGWNTLRCQNYGTNQWNGATADTGVKNWAYTYWDYVTLQITKQMNQGMLILFR